MKTKTTRPKSTATRPTATRPKVESLTVELPEEDLATFRAFADHFGFTPEMVMQHGVTGQLSALGDDTISTLAWFEELPPAELPEAVTLELLPEDFALLKLVASLVRRPVEEFAANLLRVDAQTFGSEMEDARKKGGIEQAPTLAELAGWVMKFEFEFRRGRVRRERGRDGWEWLNLEKWRPRGF